ncbi:peptidyl-prolyl cis-trans isomerase [Parablastomonas sp. CN1-191]|uniref:peptidylprolyl isomerase n=1 Tax=Parablastomonas sp. CN1-191 TaxID=3400908 RepID=UPI003BF7B3C3
MIETIRRLMFSKLGAAVTLLFLAVIAVAFAAGDISNFGSVAGGGDRVATIGSKRITQADLSTALSNRIDSLRQDQPGLTAKQFVAGGGVEPLLAALVDRLAVLSWGESHGVRASDRLIDSEIAKIPVFRGVDGQFNEALYRQTIRQRGLTDAQVRSDMAQGLGQRLLLSGAEMGGRMPQSAAMRYAAVITERRKGAIVLVPSSAFAPANGPDDAALTAFYRSNLADYQRPETRTIRYAAFTDAALPAVPAPTDAELAARYQANKAAYAPSETRRMTQLIVPTEAAARAIAAEVAAGKSLEAAASAKGLTTAKISVTSKGQLSGQASPAVADAAYATAKGGLSAPARSPLGWHLIRIDAVDAKPGKTLEQAKPELATALMADKRRAALSDFTAKIEERFDNGSSLTDVAKSMNMTVQETPALTADGKVFGGAGGAPPVLARVVQSAFAMESEGQPQIAEIEPGKAFIIYDVGRLTAAAPAPLAQIRDQVAADWKLAQGATKARQAAQRVEAALKRGADVASAVAAAGVALPPVERIDLAREQLQAMKPSPPPPVQVMFAMAKGKTRIMGAPGDRGWFVLKLDDVIPGQVAANDPRLLGLVQQLGQVHGSELAEELAGAMRKDVGVKRNEAAVKAVVDRLTGN